MDVRFDLLFKGNEIRPVSQAGRDFVAEHGTGANPGTYQRATDARLSISTESFAELERLSGAVTA
jgi:hypothetical protein